MPDQKPKRNKRLTVKFLSLLLLGILLYHIIKQGRPETTDLLGMFDLLGKSLMIVGLVIAWKWEGTGGWFLVAGYALVAILQGRIFWGVFFPIYPVLGIIYLSIWAFDTVISLKKKKD